MAFSPITSYDLFFRQDNAKAIAWSKKLQAVIARKWPKLRRTDKKPDLLVVLGGDGAILQAAKLYPRGKTRILGLNLGHVGFLASVRDEAQFIKTLTEVLNNRYVPIPRMSITATVLRQGKPLYHATALNEVVVEDMLGMVSLEIKVDEHPIQYIQGTGVLIATPTGSTAWNLSAHGPIVVPDLECCIITELVDHNIPTPSVVVHPESLISVRVQSFRARNLLTLPGGKDSVDVVIVTDGDRIFPLQKNDVVEIRKSPTPIVFASIEKNYFFKSIKEKIGFQ